MKNYNKSYFKLSVFFSVFLPVIIPLNPIKDGMLKYQYGFPFHFITIYQFKPKSNWLFFNLFNGNEGIALDPMPIIINAIMIYIIIVYLVDFFNKIVKKSAKYN
ncbi:hypothetical protein [Clostridium estertheticum]|uniref:hypothetical protein n=1 Tax=Clostridium estertheticum TaxID=238834 RepID=UPI001C0E0C2C|nr:hypothetical protein [Clostridium estertheticum]MBU3171804.1 hypothetical protein [Clostridium estertheticum]